jgi:hypothetical protein
MQRCRARTATPPARRSRRSPRPRCPPASASWPRRSNARRASTTTGSPRSSSTPAPRPRRWTTSARSPTSSPSTTSTARSRTTTSRSSRRLRHDPGGGGHGRPPPRHGRCTLGRQRGRGEAGGQARAAGCPTPGQSATPTPRRFAVAWRRALRASELARAFARPRAPARPPLHTAPDKPTPRQQRYLRQLAEQTGTSFTPPGTKAQAGREIKRLEGRARDPRADRVRDRRAIQADLQAGVGDSVRHVPAVVDGGALGLFVDDMSSPAGRLASCGVSRVAARQIPLVPLRVVVSGEQERGCQEEQSGDRDRGAGAGDAGQ